VTESARGSAAMGEVFRGFKVRDRVLAGVVTVFIG
jgi:hypothetical protein